MMAGGYTLDLYCDNKGEGFYDIWKGDSLYDKFGHQHNEFPHQFYNEFGSTCRRLARISGWYIGREKQLCPKCSGKVTNE